MLYNWFAHIDWIYYLSLYISMLRISICTFLCSCIVDKVIVSSKCIYKKKSCSLYIVKNALSFTCVYIKTLMLLSIIESCFDKYKQKVMIWLFDGFKRKYNSSSFSNAFKGKYPRVSMMQWSGTEHRKLLPCQSVIHLWNWHFWSEINDQHKIYALISNLMRNWCPISGKHFWIFILFPDTHSVSHVK